MLCESKQRISLIGALYFMGVIVASTIIPVGYLSDKFGRKAIYCISITI